MRGILAAQMVRVFPARRLLQIALIAAFMLPILAHAYAGRDSRYMADDYCLAASSVHSSVSESLNYWYTNWTGRYTAITLLAMLGKQPPQIYVVMVPIMLLLWVTVSLWVLAQLFDLLDVAESGWLSILFTVMISYAVFDGLPNVFQAVYWVNSAANYLLPLIGLLAYIGLALFALRRRPSPAIFALELAVGLCLLFVAAGCSETYAVLQLTILSLLFVASWCSLPVAMRPRLTIWLALGLIVTLIGLAIMLRAPGNSVRQDHFEPIAPLPVVIERAAIATLSYIFLALWRFTAIPLIAVLVVAAAAAYQTPIPTRVGHLSRGFVRRGLLITLGLTLLIMGATIAPSVYALSTPPPARVYVLVQPALVIGTLVWGVLIGWGLQSGDRQRQLRRSQMFSYGGSIFLAVLVIVGPVAGAIHTAALTRGFDVYASEWDAQDRDLRAAQARGETDVVVPPLTIDMAAFANLDMLGADINGSVNSCASNYYGLKSLRVQ